MDAETHRAVLGYAACDGGLASSRGQANLPVQNCNSVGIIAVAGPIIGYKANTPCPVIAARLG